MSDVNATRLLEVRVAVKRLLELSSDESEFLQGELKFDVVSDESDPHRVECLHVSVTANGIRMETMEKRRADRQVAAFSWHELMCIERAFALRESLQQEINELSVQVTGKPAVIKMQ